ncbi:MAG TPA: S49 family peptidase, partial [Planctomycetota bacterium]|nr:S49 family peptidase [Planctomycetota bacterium]
MNEQHQITRVLQAFYGNAWLIEPAKFEAIAEFLDARGTGTLSYPEQIRAAAASKRTAPAEPAELRIQGVGIIPINDVLVHRTYAVSNWSGGTSTEQVGRTFDAMMADPAVGAIVLDIDSPGGMYEGTRELADKIAAASKLNTKRIVALANGYAASGAYWLGVSAQQFFSIPSGEVGSIGVIQMHVDQSGLDEKVGVKRTLMR